MKSKLRSSGVLLRVKDIKKQRIFYRDLLRLGNPLVDSDFWVEFATADGGRIILEKSEANYLEHLASATSMIIAVTDKDAVIKELLDHKYKITVNEKVHPGEAFHRGEDPEGNVFYLCTP
jgi:catechol 2,3-dioxygenase-like lactoylglutathione lyase family enzyme